MIAEKAGMTDAVLDDIYYVALLHDVGKIRVPDIIINKPTKLTDEEYDIIKKHPEVGYGILESINDFPDIAIGALSHHERFDGKGYPKGLMGDEIPEIGRIIAVADSYDAMTSNRSYRKYMPQEKVREEIVRGRGSQFDPRYADIMLDIIDNDKDYRLHE